MIKAELGNTEKQLQDYASEVQLRLEAMVRGFASEIADAAVKKTPVGDAKLYAKYYKARPAGMPDVEGMSRANWQYSPTGQASAMMIADGSENNNVSIDIVLAQAASYKLGDSFYITNATPYIQLLENDKSTQTLNQGIGKPTIELIKTTYAVDLLRYYKGNT